MANIVFGSQRGEVIADLLYAFTRSRVTDGSVVHPLNMCAKYLVDLPSPSPPPRLRPLVIQSIELIDHLQFETAGVENLVRLLNLLDVGIDDVDSRSSWTDLLVWIVKSNEGRDRLSYSYWELLVELSLPYVRLHQALTAYDRLQIAISLQDAQEWDRLACWICFVWMEWPSAPGEDPGDLGRATTLVFRQRPDSIRKLERWMGRSENGIPTALRELCERGRLEAEQPESSLPQ